MIMIKLKNTDIQFDIWKMQKHINLRWIRMFEYEFIIHFNKYKYIYNNDKNKKMDI